MKIIKTANGNKIKISRKEWEAIGKKAGWITQEAVGYEGNDSLNEIIDNAIYSLNNLLTSTNFGDMEEYLSDALGQLERGESQIRHLINTRYPVLKDLELQKQQRYQDPAYLDELKQNATVLIEELNTIKSQGI